MADLALAVAVAGADAIPRIPLSRLTHAPRVGTVAVVPVMGIVSHKGDRVSALSGGTATEAIRYQVREAMADPTVSAIVLNIDSPGGSVAGVLELVDEIHAARARKGVVAIADSLAASAGYWIGSAASEFVVTPSGSCGSIGVLAMHEDLSGALEQEGVNVSLISAGKYKTEASPYQPLSTDAREAIQARVNEAYATFVRSVARGRQVAESTVRQGFGEGRTVGAKKALELGMADRIATLGETITRLQAPPIGRRSVTARRFSLI